jgi:hypothetical protein
LWAALPKIQKTPKKIIVKQGFHGGVDVGVWLDAATALVGFGASSILGSPSPDMVQIFKAAGVGATGLQGGLSPDYEMMHVGGGNFTHPPSPHTHMHTCFHWISLLVSSAMSHFCSFSKDI